MAVSKTAGATKAKDQAAAKTKAAPKATAADSNLCDSLPFFEQAIQSGV